MAFNATFSKHAMWHKSSWIAVILVFFSAIFLFRAAAAQTTDSSTMLADTETVGTTGTDGTGTTGFTEPAPTQFPTTPPPPLISGCERLFTFDGSRYAEGQAPACFCDEEFEGTLTISCLSGSTVIMLNDTLNLVRKSGWDKPVRQLYTNKLAIEDVHITQGFFRGLAIQQLTMENCKGVFYMDDGALDGLEGSLWSVKINKCYLGPSTLPLMFKGHGLLTEINMYRNGIIYQIQSDAFEGLRALESLDLSRNQIPYLQPGTFKPLQNLKFLNIENNHLNESVWSEINELAGLLNLSMRGNRVQDFPSGAVSNLKNLQYADFSENNFVYLQTGALEGLENANIVKLQVNGINQTDGDCLQPLKMVDTLFLDGNFMTGEDLNILYNLPNLRVLGLRNNAFETIPDDSFSRLPNLTRLELGYNYQFKNLNPGSFNGLTSLEVLGLQSTTLKHLNRSIDADILPSLRELDFSGHSLERLPRMFFQGATQLEVLQLYRGSFTTIRYPESFSILPNLKILDISENQYYCDDKMIRTVEWIQQKIEDYLEGKTELQFIDWDSTYCEEPEKHHLTILRYLNTSDMTERVERNLTSSEEVNEFFGWTDSGDATTFLPGNGVPLPDMKVYSEDVQEEQKKKHGPVAAAIVGVIVAMVLITALAVVVVVTRHVRKQRKAERIHPLGRLEATEYTKSPNLHIGLYENYGGSGNLDSSSPIESFGVSTNNSGHHNSLHGRENGISGTKDATGDNIMLPTPTFPPPPYVLQNMQHGRRLDSSEGYESVKLDD